MGHQGKQVPKETRGPMVQLVNVGRRVIVGRREIKVSMGRLVHLGLLVLMEGRVQEETG